VGNVDGRVTVAPNAEPIAQPNQSDWRAQIEHPAPTGPQPLPDPFGTERGVRSARPTHRTHPVQQPVASAVARQFQFDAPVTAGPQLLPDIAPDIVRVRQLAQPDRHTADRQPAGHAEKRHVRQVHETQVRLFGRQPVEVRLLQRRLCVHGFVGQPNQTASNY